MWHFCPEYLCSFASVVVNSFCIFSPWHLLHFLAFQKPAAQLKKPSVATVQKKTQESDSSDSDSDDESDEDLPVKAPVVAKKKEESSESSESESESEDEVVTA